MTPADFILNGIYKIVPGERSYERKSYYVEVIEIGNDFIVTNIPDKHSLIIQGPNWEYQTNRMTYIGKNRDFLFNQEFKLAG